MNEDDFRHQELLEEYGGNIDVKADVKVHEHPSESYQKMVKMGMLGRLANEVDHTRSAGAMSDNASVTG